MRQRRFALLVTGSALNAIGSWATLIAVWGYATAHFHAGPADVALLGVAWSLPGAVIGPLAGVPIDRFDARRVLIAANLVGCVASLAMALAGSFAALVVLAGLSGVVKAFGQPAASSLPPRLVDDADLLAANAWLGAASQSALVAGPLCGSLAISLWGVRAPFIFDAITFVVGAAAIVPLRLRVIEKAEHVHPVKELTAGFRIARRIPNVRRTLTLATAVFCTWGAFFVIEPLYVRDVLHRSPAVLGLFQSAFGIGLVGATLVLPKIGDRVATLRSLAISVAVSGVAAATYVGTHSIVVALVGVFIWGIDVAFFVTPMQTLLQRSAPVEAHGRVLALSWTVNGVGNSAAIPFAGLAIAAFGVRATGAIAGALAVGAGLVGLGLWGSDGASQGQGGDADDREGHEPPHGHSGMGEPVGDGEHGDHADGDAPVVADDEVVPEQAEAT
jgi:predicted MFS family arabinose efflux permease